MNTPAPARRPRGRRRRTLGWTLIATALMLAGASAWSYGRSAWIGAEGHGRVWSLTLTGGVVQWSLQRGAIDTYHAGGGWEIGREPSAGAWTWDRRVMAVQKEWRPWNWRWVLVSQRGGWHRFVSAPVWPLAVAAAASGVSLITWGGWVGRRIGLCSKCGYDLRGLGADGACPECGNPMLGWEKRS